MKKFHITFFVLLVCVVCDSYGEGSTAIFKITDTTEQGTRYANCDLKSREKSVTVKEGSLVRIDVESQLGHIQKSECFMHGDRLKQIIETPRSNDLNTDAWFLEVPNITKEKAGLWTCRLMFGNGGYVLPIDNEGYTSVTCNISIKVEAKNIPEAMKIEFKIDTSENPRCKKPHNLNRIRENQKIQIIATSMQNFDDDKHLCRLSPSETDISQMEPYLTLRREQENKIQSEEQRFDADNDGKYLICNFFITSFFIKSRYDVTCSVQLFADKSEKGRGMEQGTIIAICCAVGVIVVLIIVGQTIALIYFKSRAQRQNRLDSLVTRDRNFDRNDTARYSAPPSRRNTKSNRANAETDSHIYEMVGINALYKESSELDIKNRPPLPLPGQSPLPPPIDSLPRPPKSKLLSSTLSLGSISNCRTLPAKPAKKELPAPPTSTLNKVPCRPPKQVDEASLVGSLPRPPKPSPLPKGSSMPKMPSTDPALLELKKALERRAGNAPSSPSTSQQSTLEMKPKITPQKPKPTQKPAPKTQVIGPPLQKPAGILPPPSIVPPPGILPGGQLAPNMKLLLPKIEATLKPPPPAKPSKGAEVSSLRPQESAGPLNGPSIQQKPMLPPFRRPSAEASASSLAPVPLRLPPPQVQNSRPLPPIQPEEESHYSDDDEWTYEQLEKYNIYNI